SHAGVFVGPAGSSFPSPAGVDLVRVDAGRARRTPSVRLGGRGRDRLRPCGIKLVGGELMTREPTKLRILQKDGSGSADVESAEPAAGPQQSALARLTRHAHARERMLAADCGIIFTQSLYRQIVGHVSSNTSVEQGGLLLG